MWRCNAHKSLEHPQPKRRTKTNNTNTPPRSTCNTCGNFFRPQYSPFECSGIGCNTKVHKQLKCSTLTREQQKQGKWMCDIHGDQTPNQTIPQVRNQGTQPRLNTNCGICSKRIRVNTAPWKAQTVISQHMLPAQDYLEEQWISSKETITGYAATAKEQIHLTKVSRTTQTTKGVLKKW